MQTGINKISRAGDCYSLVLMACPIFAIQERHSDRNPTNDWTTTFGLWFTEREAREFVEFHEKEFTGDWRIDGIAAMGQLQELLKAHTEIMEKNYG